MSLIQTINFIELGDSRGNLLSLEGNKNVPFEIKRVYYIYNTGNGVSRGFHAHKELLQLAICISGSCRFIMDNGTNKEEITLNSPSTGLLIPNMIWHEMHDFSKNCVLMVLASEIYDETDYIREYSAYLDSMKGYNNVHTST